MQRHLQDPFSSHSSISCTHLPSHPPKGLLRRKGIRSSSVEKSDIAGLTQFYVQIQQSKSLKDPSKDKRPGFYFFKIKNKKAQCVFEKMFSTIQTKFLQCLLKTPNPSILHIESFYNTLFSTLFYKKKEKHCKEQVLKC